MVTYHELSPSESEEYRMLCDCAHDKSFDRRVLVPGVNLDSDQFSVSFSHRHSTQFLLKLDPLSIDPFICKWCHSTETRDKRDSDEPACFTHGLLIWTDFSYCNHWNNRAAVVYFARVLEKASTRTCSQT